MQTVTLAKTLGLRPLDRVQINNRYTISEAVLDWRQGREGELPYWYFQQILPDGRIEVRAPGGTVSSVEPGDICDIVPGTPVMIQAMPKHVFLERLKLGPNAGQPGPECYAPAYVRYVMKDRWGRVDTIAVTFVDEALNHDTTTFAPVAQGERERIAAQAKRTTMPVMSRTGSAYSADHGIAATNNLAAATVNRFFKASLSGQTEVVERLTMAGVNPVRRVELNRL